MEPNSRTLARRIAKEPQDIVDRFWGIFKTFRSRDTREVERALNAVNSKIKTLKHKHKLLEAESMAYTAVLKKRIEALNGNRENDKGRDVSSNP